MKREKPTPSFIRLTRTAMVSGVIFPTEQYPKLRAFFAKEKAEDDQQVLLKPSSPPAGANGAQ